MACEALDMQDEVVFLAYVVCNYIALVVGLSFNCPVLQELWRKLTAGSDITSWHKEISCYREGETECKVSLPFTFS